ncbi:MAG: hypothetical protein EAY69_04150 [Cytophagales bacterium]|nr:MAG: hypothetical protein EAY69_04150 [Cytophagales bacterium]
MIKKITFYIKSILFCCFIYHILCFYTFEKKNEKKNYLVFFLLSLSVLLLFCFYQNLLLFLRHYLLLRYEKK